MKHVCKKMVRTVIEMNTGTKVIRSKKDKSNSRRVLNKLVRDMY